MPTCEKCWADAGQAATGFAAIHVEYDRLCDERTEHHCTPEQQAGPWAVRCPTCQRRTLHQYVGVCMNPGCVDFNRVRILVRI